MGSTRTVSRKSFRDVLRRDKYLVLMIIPAFMLFAVFSYLPMFGIVMSFQDFVPGRGFLGSRWVGLKWFKYFVSSVYFGRLLRNTVLLSVYSLLFGMPMTILFALLLNELRSRTFKRIVQTVTYLPYFISTVIMVSILQMLLSYPRGVVNSALSALGLTEINFFQEAGWFRTLYIGSGIWQGLGWNSILYLAALTSINPDLYEAAYMDGANRLQQMWHISLPGMMNTIVTMLILSLGGIFSVGYEKVYLMYNPVTMDQADVISTYVYRTGLESMRYSYASAIGLFNSVINFAVLLLANTLSRKITEIGLW
ncbi:MAG: ABC transporter permease subunit [Eubacteriales bacterium]|nr:ABC transporter permease subunit [bacterium]MDY2792841.1 ABC transporter permease subunit [Eubacteriales bacterium]